jgi:transposase-like protein
MIVISCQHPIRHKHGKNKCGNQRYKCADCGATFVDESGPLGNMRLSMKDATLALNLMLEGMSIRSVQRITGLCRQTLADLIILVGENCARMLESTVKGVEVNELQVDEIWGFIGC